MQPHHRHNCLLLTTLCTIFLAACKDDGGDSSTPNSSVAPMAPVVEIASEPDEMEVEEEAKPPEEKVTLEPEDPPAITFIPGVSLPVRAETSVLEILKNRDTSRNIFVDYHTDPDLPVMPASNWTSGTRTTGVAWNAQAAGTLISPRHVLLAEHFSGNVGRELVFHDAAGFAHFRRLIAIDKAASATSTDIAVGLLDREVSAIPHYSVLPARSDYSTLINGALAIVASAKQQLGITRIQASLNGQIAFRYDTELPADLRLPLESGDSGHPAFLLIGREMILLSTHEFGNAGRGPFISEPGNFAAINAAMLRLGGNHLLTVTEVPVP